MAAARLGGAAAEFWYGLKMVRSNERPCHNVLQRSGRRSGVVVLQRSGLLLFSAASHRRLFRVTVVLCFAITPLYNSIWYVPASGWLERSLVGQQRHQPNLGPHRTSLSLLLARWCRTRELLRFGEVWEKQGEGLLLVGCLQRHGQTLTRCPQSLVVPEGEFQYVLRIVNTNVDGAVNVVFALTAIKGVGRRFAGEPLP